ncbi:hypothetical protein Mterra_02313 [Calidithermus terrae]|uniref:Uncharacterized protein n=1 Tax=Calidithermus terrae TaxID=1408545 RepID=A0A399EMK3_9DEIN|nr:hypothetical protein [Calidithermus terrae]RIH83361.1 hypothetical protein Mterra_02313 [Calidithermus terrae]
MKRNPLKHLRFHKTDPDLILRRLLVVASAAVLLRAIAGFVTDQGLWAPSAVFGGLGLYIATKAWADHRRLGSAVIVALMLIVALV